MLETITTNGVTILTIIVLWSVLTWVATYMYTSTRIRRLENKISVMDWYAYELEKELDKTLTELQDINEKYGDVIDDYIQHYYSNDEWVQA